MDASLPSSSTSLVHVRASASSSACSSASSSASSSDSSPHRVPFLMSDDEEKKWPKALEKHFIDILLEEDAKGNMPQGQFKSGTWTAVMNEFNKRANKNYTKPQLTQKYQRMKQRHRLFSQLIARTGMGWDPISNTVTASEEAWAAAFAVNHKFKEFKKKGVRHYDLLGMLFNSNTATGFLQMSSAQPAPNSDEERELDAAFLSEGVHVNVNFDCPEVSVEELATPSEAQSRRQAEKRPAEPSSSSGKRKKGHSLESMTEAIWGFTEMRNRGGKKSNTAKSGVGADSEHSITAAITLLNEHTDVDHVTYCKVVQELHNSKSRAAFFAMTVDRRRAWIDFVGGGLQ